MQKESACHGWGETCGEQEGVYFVVKCVHGEFCSLCEVMEKRESLS